LWKILLSNMSRLETFGMALVLCFALDRNQSEVPFDWYACVTQLASCQMGATFGCVKGRCLVCSPVVIFIASCEEIGIYTRIYTYIHVTYVIYTCTHAHVAYCVLLPVIQPRRWNAWPVCQLMVLLISATTLLCHLCSTSSCTSQ